jgi:hypothetical protein
MNITDPMPTSFFHIDLAKVTTVATAITIATTAAVTITVTVTTAI